MREKLSNWYHLVQMLLYFHVKVLYRSVMETRNEKGVEVLGYTRCYNKHSQFIRKKKKGNVSNIGRNSF